MSLRLPQKTSSSFGTRTGESVLAFEMVEEQAAALGNAGRLVELRLQELASLDQSSALHAALVQRAADAVFAYFVQREVCGFADHSGPIEHYSIPNKVLAKVGVISSGQS